MTVQQIRAMKWVIRGLCLVAGATLALIFA